MPREDIPNNAQGQSERGEVPEDATHMRRPEYITAWLFDRVSTMPTWLIPNYQSRPLPAEKIGHYATAVDGAFWRWFDPAKFEEMFVPAHPSHGGDSEAGPFRVAIVEECARFADTLIKQEGRTPEWHAQTQFIPDEIRALSAPQPLHPAGPHPDDPKQGGNTPACLFEAASTIEPFITQPECPDDTRKEALRKAKAVLEMRGGGYASINAPELPDILNPPAIDQLFARNDLYTARAVFARLRNFGFSFVRTSEMPSTDRGGA